MRQGRGAPRSRRPLLASRVVGRDSELRILRDLVNAAAEAAGDVVFLVGEAGIGKSRLARAATMEAEALGLPTLRGRAVETATPIAYRPLTEALCSAVRLGTVPGAAELGPYGAALGRLIPEWRGEEQEPGDHSVVLLAEGVLRFLRAIAGTRGSVLVLEDLHWADPETLSIVEYLADNVAAQRVLCVATLRVDQPTAALDLVRALEARRVSKTLRLSRLDDDEVAEMLRSCLDAETLPEGVMALAARADGVPFLVEELLAVAVDSGALVDDAGDWSMSSAGTLVVPLTFADSVRRRLATLGEETRSVLVAAAVLGRRFDWDLLPAITGLAEDQVLAALHAAVDAQIVSVETREPAFRFRHALSRDAVLAQLFPSERAALSRQALEAVESAHPDLEADWGELAAELAVAAGEHRHAAALLLDAGRRAVRAGAVASAEAILERASALAPFNDPLAAEVEECLVDALSLAGKRDRAVEVGESLLGRLRRDPAAAGRRAETHLRLARAAVAATHWDEAAARIDQARADAADAGDERLAARVQAVAAQAAIVRRPDDAAAFAREALTAAERLGLPEVACEALEVLGRWARPRDLDAAAAAFTRAEAIAAEHGLKLWRVRALHELGTIDLLTDGAVTRLEEARQLALAQGALATAAVLDVQIAAGLILRDDPEPAAVIARRGAELAKRYGLRQTCAAATAFEAHVHARAGRRRQVEECLSRAEAEGGDDGDLNVLAQLARTILAFVEEDRTEAIRQLSRAVIPVAQSSGDQASGPISGVWSLVRAVESGRDAGLPPVPGDEPVHVLARAYQQYAGAVVHGRAGKEDRARELMAEGDRLLQDLNWYRQYGRRLVAEAAIGDGWGDPVAWLREAEAFFARKGADRIASACRSLLRQAGAAVPRRRRGSDDVPTALRALGVTGRELEVLRLVGEGLSNKEIGARLYLSPRTVERHVANLAAKAGVERRSQLVSFAARATEGDASPD